MTSVNQLHQLLIISTLLKIRCCWFAQPMLTRFTTI